MLRYGHDLTLSEQTAESGARLMSSGYGHECQGLIVRYIGHPIASVALNRLLRSGSGRPRGVDQKRTFPSLIGFDEFLDLSFQVGLAAGVRSGVLAGCFASVLGGFAGTLVAGHVETGVTWWYEVGKGFLTFFQHFQLVGHGVVGRRWLDGGYAD